MFLLLVNFLFLTEVIRKTIVTLHLAMWAVGKLEQAVETCTSGCTAMDCYEESVYSWDQAVAFYSGTNPGDKLPFHDADKYCKYFGTCGEDRELMEGTAQVNHKLMDYFKEGQTSIVNGDCQSALQMKEQIEALMTVPNIQGTLRNIWKGYENMEKGEVHKVEKHRGEAIAYTAALLPLVHDCNAKDAEIIHDYIFTADLDLDSYKAVKEALERNYECMKVQCADVGGFTGKESDEYKDFHIPCNVQQASSSPNAVKLGFGIGVAVGVAVLSLL